MITTTLQKLKNANACTERYKHLRAALGKDFGLDTILPLVRILEINGREDTLWVLHNAIDGDKLLQLWAADCAEHVLSIFLKERPNDTRPADAIKARRQFTRGEIRATAWAAARAAARAAAGDAAWDAAWAAAGDAAWDAAWAAAGDAAWAAAGDAAWDAAWAAAGDAAWAAETQWQTDRLISYLKEEAEAESSGGGQACG